MTQRQRSAFTVTCDDCGVETGLNSANEIVDFYRRHHRQTGHDVTITRADLAFELPTDGDLESVVADLETHYEDGVPIGSITAAMREQGFTVGETLEEIYDVRMTGALYEPRDDHLASV